MRDEEIARFREQMKLLQRRLRSETSPVEDVSHTAVRVLAVAERLPGNAQPGQVAEALRMTTSNVAAALRELQTAGLIVRRRDPEDARRVLIQVTAKGERVVADVRRERDTWLGQAIDALLDDDEKRVLRNAGRLMERLAAYAPPAAPEGEEP